MESLQPLAVFDFDDTLAQGDSMWRFFALVAGWPRMAVALFQASGVFLWQHVLRQEERTQVEFRTFLKEQMLQRLIAGRSVMSFTAAVAQLRQSTRWNDAMRRILQEHCDRGHHVVIASGSLDIYLLELLKDVPHHAVLCTEIGVKDGIATGVMVKGNCVRQGKADRLAAYIAEHGPCGESWGYGNFPDDVPMLNLLKHRVLV